jgi:hypothetical protein
MGQYFRIVNLDKQEYIDPDSNKLWELCANNEARLLPWLLAKGPQDGTSLSHTDRNGELIERRKGEDFDAYIERVGEEANVPIGQGRFKTPGRWAGDRVVVVGDYDESGLYQRAKKEFKEISAEVIPELNEFLGIEKLKVGGPGYIMPDMVATSGGGIYTDPKIETPQTENLSKSPGPSEQKSGPGEIAEGWRKHRTHREETQAVKKALEKAGIKAKVGHDTGTAWGWLVINLGPNPSGLEHRKMEGTPTPWLCAGGCPACERNRELRDQTLRIAQEVTGRHGDYDGEISILMQ